MNVAFVLAVCASTLSLATAISHFAIARAPGWRSARTFGFVALTAGLYSLFNIGQCVEGLPAALYVASDRWNYVFAGLHVMAWFPFAFGGPEASFRAMPRLARVLFAIEAVPTAVLVFTGWQHGGPLYTHVVGWAHVTYHNVEPSLFGNLYAALGLALLGVVYAGLFARWRRGERELGIILVGFGVFFVCATIEVLVTLRLVAAIFPGDIGFLAVVVPTFVQLLRRFVRDAHRLRELTGRLETQVRERTSELDEARIALVEAERLAALGQLAAGVGHEINNPLTYTLLSLDVVHEHLERSDAPTAVRAMLDNARDGARRIQRVVEGLRTYSRRGDERAPVSLDEIVRDALRVAGPQLRHVARVDADAEGAPWVLGDAPRLVQALVNLLANAAQALGEHRRDGNVRVRAGLGADGWAWLEVRDDGPGIPPEHLAHLAEPYYTTRAGRGGLGLGLFVTRGIIDAHGGRLEFESLAAGGACARIVLPALPAPAIPQAAAAPPSPALAPVATPIALAPAPATPSPAPIARAPAAACVRARVLVVDDEPLVLDLLTGLLASHYDVTGAPSGRTALARLAAQGFDAVVCDLMMPGLSGIDLAEELSRRDPRLRARMVFLTGGAVTAEAQAFLDRADVVHLMKPVDFGALRAALAGALASAPAPR